MTPKPDDSNQNQKSPDSAFRENRMIIRTKQFRKLKTPVKEQPVQVASEKPIDEDNIVKKAPAQPEEQKPEPLDPKSLKFEFDFRIGSTVEARKSLITGFLAMVLIPAIIILAILLAFTSQLSVPYTIEEQSLLSSLNFMLATIAAMSFPIMLISWVNGLYPRGSYGRFASGSVYALLLGIWLALLFVGSNLQTAFTEYGLNLQIGRILVLIFPMAIFLFARAVFELFDNRRHWRKSIGAEVKISPLNLQSSFLDFDPRIGKFQNGNEAAKNAYIRFLIIPTIVLVALDGIIGQLQLENSIILQASVGTMFGTVLIFGLAMVIIRFFSRFYPKGSYGRTAFGIMGIPVIIFFATGILIGSGLEEAFRQNHFLINMGTVALPVIAYILFFTVFELSELIDNRRKWHKEIGKPVVPFDPEEELRHFDDFRARFATFVTGARKALLTMASYVFGLVLVIIILEALLVSTLPSDNSIAKGVIGIVHYASNFLLFWAIVIPPQVFFRGSYRKGSFARLLSSAMICIFLAIWAYVLWGTMARKSAAFDLSAYNLGMFAPMVGSLLSSFSIICIIVMVVLIAWAGIKAFFAWWEYLKHKTGYLTWRLSIQGREVLAPKPLPVPGVPAAKKAFPWRFPSPIHPRSPAFPSGGGFPSHEQIPATAYMPTGIAYADQGISSNQDGPFADNSSMFLQRPYGFWSKEMIIEQLKDYVNEYESTDLMSLRAPHLYIAINSEFGNINRATKEAKIEFKDLVPRTEWSKERIIRDIQQLHEMGEDLSATNVQRLEPNLIGLAPKYFGSWKGAIKAAGYDYDGIRRDWILGSFQESKFEEYVEIALEKIGWKVKPHMTFNIQNQTNHPDFYDPQTGIWIAAELDAGSYSTHMTIQKYLPFTNKIMIIYLKGRPGKKDSELAQFIRVSQFYDQLSNIGSGDLINRIESLNQKQLGPDLRKDLHEYIRKEHLADRKSEEQILNYFRQEKY